MISRQTLDQIRKQASLATIVSESVRLEKAGRNFKGLCPFHQEKTPSFTVSTERDIFFCFGCKASGDVFKFVSLLEGLSFIEAAKKLAERYAITLDEDDRSPAQKAADQRQKRERDDLFSANSFASAFFAKMLRDHPHASLARYELERRGLLLDDPEMRPVLESFGVGYAPSGWDELSRALQNQGFSPTMGERLGLTAPRKSGQGHYDLFRNRLMVTIHDVAGKVIGFSGRVLPAAPGEQVDATRGPPPKYVNSRESEIYSKGQVLFGLYQARAAIRQTNEVIVVEGNFDLIALHARKIANVVAPLGTAFTPDQARLLRKFAAEVTLMFDADAAGLKATWASRDHLRTHAFVARVARLPKGKDPDEFLQKEGRERMIDVLKAARSLDEVLIESICEPLGEGADLAKKQAALAQIRPLLEQQEPSLRSVLAKHVAARLGLDVAVFWQSVRGEKSPAPTRKGENRPKESEQERLSREIVECLFYCPELAESDWLQETSRWLVGDWVFALKYLRDAVRLARKEKKSLDAPSLLAQLPSTIQEIASERLVGSAPNLLARGRSDTEQGGDSEADLVQRVIRENGQKLMKRAETSKIADIEKAISVAESEGNFALAMDLAEQKVRLVQAMRRSSSH